MKKVILITGASSGIGKETALHLLSEGHIVYGAARNKEAMKEIIIAGGYSIALDITNDGDIKNCVQKIIKQQGKIDILWNNAGYGLYGAIEDVSIEEAKKQFEVNIFGLAAITKEVLPYMRKQKSGLIINTSSMGGKIYMPLGAWYHATKHALEGWSDCLRLELQPFGINVVILEPGVIQTNFGEIMSAGLLKQAPGSNYKDLIQTMIAATKRTYSISGGGSPSSLIAKTISKIIASKKPKTRYLVGKYAKPVVFLRKWFGDRIYDKVIMMIVK